VDVVEPCVPLRSRSRAEARWIGQRGDGFGRQRGVALHADGLVEARQLRELAALGANLFDLVMPRQAALDELHTTMPHVGDVERVLILQPHDRGDIRLGVELAPEGKHDPNEAECEQQGDDEQCAGDEIAFGLDQRGECIAEHGGDGPEQEQQEGGQNRPYRAANRSVDNL
jgi:hypothetical protein